MNLKNLALAAMIATAFASCSNENDPVVTPEPTTSLSIKMDKVQTKADSDIGSLSVLVYNQSNTLEVIGTKTTADEALNISVLPGSKKVVVLANATAQLGTAGVTVGTAYSILAGAIANFTAESPDALTMNSAEYAINITAGQHHYLGYTQDKATAYNFDAGNWEPVKLYRNVAKAIIGKITLDDVVLADQARPNAKFVLKSIFVTQSPGQSKLAGGAISWAPTYLETATWASSYSTADYTALKTGKFAKAPAVVAVPIPAYTVAGIDFSITKDASYAPAAAAQPTFYLYENLRTKAFITTTVPKAEPLSLITISGEMSYDVVDGPDEDTAADRFTETVYYSFAVGVSGFTAAGYPITGFEIPAGSRSMLADNKALGVLRNLQYQISLNIKNFGYTDPHLPDLDPTLLDVKVQVVPWGTVIQDIPLD